MLSRMLLAASHDSVREVGVALTQLDHPPADWAEGGVTLYEDGTWRIGIFRTIDFNRCAKFFPGRHPLGCNHDPVLKQAKNPAKVPITATSRVLISPHAKRLFWTTSRLTAVVRNIANQVGRHRQRPQRPIFRQLHWASGRCSVIH